MSSTNVGSDLLKKYQDFLKKISAKDYRLTVGDRRVYTDLSRQYGAVSEDDNTYLDDLTKLQNLLSETQKYFR